MEYLHQISKGEYVISFCMIRQHNPDQNATQPNLWKSLYEQSVKSTLCEVYRDGVYRKNKSNKILLQKLRKYLTFILTRMQHNLICESPFMKKSVKSTWRDAGRSPRAVMRWNFPTHGWNSRLDRAIWSEAFQPMTEIPYLIEQFLFLANEQKRWFQCHWQYSH